jgi:hypothetical protein
MIVDHQNHRSVILVLVLPLQLSKSNKTEDQSINHNDSNGVLLNLDYFDAVGRQIAIHFRLWIAQQSSDARFADGL